MAADTPKRMPAASEGVPASDRPTLPPASDETSHVRTKADDVSGTRSIGSRRALVKELGERFGNGDYEGALALAETVDANDEAYAVASLCISRCKLALEQIFIDRVGGLGHVPRLALSGSALRSARLDHRAGFIVAMVDGSLCVEEIVDASSMPRFEALRILDDLVARGIVD